MSRKFVIGDIHGAHIPLQQCLNRCNFDYNDDLLITIGDVCDGWPYVYECVEELLKIKNRIDIRGNHDEWFYNFIKTGYHPDGWKQGGKGTKLSYLRNKGITETGLQDHESVLLPGDIPESHRVFFAKQHLYYKDDQNNLFVHGGINRSLTLKQQQHRCDAMDFYWDRDLFLASIDAHICKTKLLFAEEFSHIFIGHTQTNHYTCAVMDTSYISMKNTGYFCPPLFVDRVINLDTGAGSIGRLTIMDIDSLEFFQSDIVTGIYGIYKPRG